MNNVIWFVLCICAKDGFISSEEENETFLLFNKAVEEKKIPFKKITQTSFQKLIDEFFSSNLQLEDYLIALKGQSYTKEILKMSEMAASADGLNILENIAFLKAKKILLETE
jgi:hypothetical protein